MSGPWRPDSFAYDEEPVGLFDFFKSRSEKESAVQGAMSSDQSLAGSTSVDQSAIGSIKGMWDMSKQIREAMEQGNFSVSQQSQTIDARDNEELRNAILKTLNEHGVDAQKGQTVQVTDPETMKAIFQTLSEHSEDLAHMQQQALANLGGFAAAGGAQFGGSGGDDSLSQLERLQKLHDQGILTGDEFEQQKRKILGA